MQNIWEESGQAKFGVDPKGDQQDPNLVPKWLRTHSHTLSSSWEKTYPVCDEHLFALRCENSVCDKFVDICFKHSFVAFSWIVEILHKKLALQQWNIQPLKMCELQLGQDSICILEKLFSILLELGCNCKPDQPCLCHISLISLLLWLNRTLSMPGRRRIL